MRTRSYSTVRNADSAEGCDRYLDLGGCSRDREFCHRHLAVTGGAIVGITSFMK